MRVYVASGGYRHGEPEVLGPALTLKRAKALCIERAESMFERPPEGWTGDGPIWESRGRNTTFRIEKFHIHITPRR